MELYLELPARRTYGFVFFGRPVDEPVKQAVEKDLARGVRALSALTKSATAAMCSEDVPGRVPYLAMLGKRPAFAQVRADQKAAREAAQNK